MMDKLKGKAAPATSGAHALASEITSADLNYLGPILDFSPNVAARYEVDTHEERIAHLHRAICVGLVFYNTYNLTTLILMPDIALLGLILRLLWVTPISLAIAYLAGSMSARFRERLVAAGMINAIAVPIFLFWISAESTALYTAAEFPLTMIFGCMMLSLRFRQTLYFVILSFMIIVIAVQSKTGMTPILSFAFSVQAFSACLFVLYGNYKIEAGKRQTYLRTLSGILSANQLRRDHQILTNLSNTDALTGISNRRHLDAALTDLFRSRRYQHATIVLMMIDVDHFKQFNDTYGHLAGDHCLGDVAGALIKGLRTETDLLARYGGEEFAVLMRNCHEDATADVAERLRLSVLSLAIPHTGRKDEPPFVSISIGGCVVRAGDEWTIEKLISEADEALYAAKRFGRNQYVIRRVGTRVSRDCSTVSAPQGPVAAEDVQRDESRPATADIARDQSRS